MKKNCSDCLHSRINLGTGYYYCDKGLNDNGYVQTQCAGWKPDRPHVASEKPPLGCSPYYVNTTARIRELCEAIMRYSTVPKNHNLIKLWATEILFMNDMDRMLRRVEEEKVWVENKDGTLKEVE